MCPAVHSSSSRYSIAVPRRAGSSVCSPRKAICSGAAGSTVAFPNPEEPGALDPRCLTGRVLCVSKSSRTLRWMIDGRTVSMTEVRFGSQLRALDPALRERIADPLDDMQRHHLLGEAVIVVGAA